MGKCKLCDKQTPHGNAKYCSKECRDKSYLIKLDCPICGKVFYRNKHRASYSTTNVCGIKCARVFTSKRMSEMNVEINHTRMIPETRRKLREARLDSGEGKTYSKYYGRHTHRVVAEKKLGRKLRKGEIVHHKDNNKRNNDPDNLEVLESQAEHARLHAAQGEFRNSKKNKDATGE